MSEEEETETTEPKPKPKKAKKAAPAKKKKDKRPTFTSSGGGAVCYTRVVTSKAAADKLVALHGARIYHSRAGRYTCTFDSGAYRSLKSVV